MDKNCKEYQRVRDRLAAHLASLDHWGWKRMPEYYDPIRLLISPKSVYYRVADRILSIEGLAILADNQNLPDARYPNSEIDSYIGEGQQDMLKANFRKIVSTTVS